MKIHYGVSINSDSGVNDLPDLPALELVEVPGDWCGSAEFALPRKWRRKKLWLRNSDDIRFFRSLPDAGSGVRQEFYRLFAKRCQAAVTANAGCCSLAPDLEYALNEPDHAAKLHRTLGVCFGIAEKCRLPLTLEVRIPGAAAAKTADFLRFKHALLYPLRTICAIHPHEPGALEALEKFAGDCKFDCDIFRVCFDAASGNYLSDNLFNKLRQFLRKSGFADPVIIFDPGCGADKNTYLELNRLAECEK